MAAADKISRIRRKLKPKRRQTVVFGDFQKVAYAAAEIEKLSLRFKSGYFFDKVKLLLGVLLNIWPLELEKIGLVVYFFQFRLRRRINQKGIFTRNALPNFILSIVIDRF